MSADYRRSCRARSRQQCPPARCRGRVRSGGAARACGARAAGRDRSSFAEHHELRPQFESCRNIKRSRRSRTFSSSIPRDRASMCCRERRRDGLCKASTMASMRGSIFPRSRHRSVSPTFLKGWSSRAGSRTDPPGRCTKSGPRHPATLTGRNDEQRCQIS